MRDGAGLPDNGEGGGPHKRRAPAGLPAPPAVAAADVGGGRDGARALARQPLHAQVAVRLVEQVDDGHEGGPLGRVLRPARLAEADQGVGRVLGPLGAQAAAAHAHHDLACARGRVRG